MAQIIRAKQGYNIIFCGLAELIKTLGKGYAVIDENVLSYGGFGYNSGNSFVMQANEKSKTFAAVEAIITHMIAAGADRHTPLTAIGGGITSDVAGYVAASYMRGVPYTVVPTTLSAMADAGIGGKNGVNVGNIKNVAGTFYLPKSIYICTEFLSTLPDAVYIQGMGELLKYALLDIHIFNQLSQDYESVLGKRQEALDRILPLCIRFKDNIAARDPLDVSGVRASLNLGHTVAHAIESATDYSVAHGDAVAVGLGVELELSRILGIADDTYYRAARVLIARHTAQVPRINPDMNELVRFMCRDKKNAGGKTAFILPKDFNNLEKILLGGGEILTLIQDAWYNIPV